MTSYCFCKKILTLSVSSGFVTKFNALARSVSPIVCQELSRLSTIVKEA